MTETRGAWGSQEARARWQSIESQHEALGHFVERVERLLSRLAEGSPGEGEGVTARRLVRELQVRLFEHLATEERNRILERAAAAAPRFHERVDRLLAEHRDLRDRMNLLAADIEAVDGEAWQPLHVRFVELRRTLRKHETAENDLLHRAYREDIGGPG